MKQKTQKIVYLLSIYMSLIIFPWIYKLIFTTYLQTYRDLYLFFSLHLHTNIFFYLFYRSSLIARGLFVKIKKFNMHTNILINSKEIPYPFSYCMNLAFVLRNSFILCPIVAPYTILGPCPLSYDSLLSLLWYNLSLFPMVRP